MPRLVGLTPEEINEVESLPSHGPVYCPECGRKEVYFYNSFGGWECGGCKMIYSTKDLQNYGMEEDDIEKSDST
jgi:ribosomal protein L37AE/L43A